MKHFIFVLFFLGCLGCDTTPKIHQAYEISDNSFAPELVSGGDNAHYLLDLMKAEDTPSGKTSPSQEVADLNAKYRHSLYQTANQNGYRIGYDQAIVTDARNEYWVATHVINEMYESTGRCPVMIGHRLITHPVMQVLFLALGGTEYSENVGSNRLIEAMAHLRTAESLSSTTGMRDAIRSAIALLDERIVELTGVTFFNSNSVDEELAKIEKLNIPEEQKVKLRVVCATIFRFKQNGDLYKTGEKLPADRTFFHKYKAGKGPVAVYAGVGFSIFYWESENVDVSSSVGFLWNGSTLVPLVDVRVTKEGENWYVYATTVQVGAGYKGMIGDKVHFRIGPFVNYAAAGIETSFDWGDLDASLDEKEFKKRVEARVTNLLVYLKHDMVYFADLSQQYLGLMVPMHPQVQEKVLLNLYRRAAQYVLNMNNRSLTDALPKKQ